MKTPSEAETRSIGNLLCNTARPMKERFRALFTLRNIGGVVAVECIAKGFEDTSALLKHECAYCLGQMQDNHAIPYLVDVLKDPNQEVIVRHEAGEALGAIGSPEVLNILEEFSKNPEPSIAETCELAITRIKWLSSSKQREEETNMSNNPYLSVDPAPPSECNSTAYLKSVLLDDKSSLFERYRAMFALRNKGDDESVLALAAGLKCSGALFRHEIAYVLGQIQSSLCIPHLIENLEDLQENEMVRHECAEALGSIAAEECSEVLKKYLGDDKRVVRESCEVALDMCEYEHSNEFQYANALCKTAE